MITHENDLDKPMIPVRMRSSGQGVLSTQVVPRSLVLRAFFQRPLQTGAVMASGAALSRSLVTLGRVDRAGLVVELGSGTGVVTRHILESCAQGSQLISLELDSHLAQETRCRCPRAVVVNEDAQNVREVIERFGHTACDSIVSCIPWANISPSRQRDMLDAVDSVLRSGGSFVTFAYVHSARLPNARHFYRELCARYPGVETSDVIWANVPPAVVYRVTKV